ILLLAFRLSGGTSLLLLLGSPLLMVFSRRVMLDVPVTLCAVTLLYCAVRPMKGRYLLFWIAALAGWWTKQHAILPALAAALVYLAVRERKTFLSVHFYSGAALFLIGMWGLSMFEHGHVHNPIVPIAAARVDSEGYFSKKPIYLDAFFVDHPILWLLPIAW